MNKYIVLDTENNKIFKPSLIGSVLEGVQVGEYIRTNKGDFLATELKEVCETATNKTVDIEPIEPIKKAIKEPKQITNKTIVINSIDTYDITNKEYKNRIKHLKSILRKRTNKELESIEYIYNEFIRLYVLASKNGIYEVINSLKKAIKPIINSCIKIDEYNLNYINSLISYGIL